MDGAVVAPEKEANLGSSAHTPVMPVEVSAPSTEMAPSHMAVGIAIDDHGRDGKSAPETQDRKDVAKPPPTSTAAPALLLSPAQISQQNTIRTKARINNFIESPAVVAVMSTCTIWALFSDDIRLSGTDMSADTGFEAVISICFFLFLSEIILASYCKGQEYLYIPPDFTKVLPGETFLSSITRRLEVGSFYFWLDLIATVSLIFDMNWVIGDSLASGKQSAKGGNAARAGARAGRIVRLVRMVRLIRLVRLYKYASKLSAKDSAAAIITSEEGEDVILPPESKVGAALTDLTTRRVIILVLVILIIIPNLEESDSDELAPMITQTIDRIARSGQTYTDKVRYLLRALCLVSASASLMPPTRKLTISYPPSLI